jgi:hypothetical protein
MSAKRFKLVAGLLVVFCASYAPVAGQKPTASSPPRQLAKIVYDGDMAALLSTLAETFNVTIGLETLPQQPKPTVKIEASEAKLEDVLNAIVRAAPGYQWRNEDGFIDVYPQESSSPLLDTVVKDFQVINTDWLAAIESLTNLLEVQTRMNDMRLTRRDFTSVSGAINLNQFSLSLRNVTLRRALHEITKKSSSGFWVFQRYGSGGRLISIRNFSF